MTDTFRDLRNEFNETDLKNFLLSTAEKLKLNTDGVVTLINMTTIQDHFFNGILIDVVSKCACKILVDPMECTIQSWHETYKFPEIALLEILSAFTHEGLTPGFSEKFGELTYLNNIYKSIPQTIIDQIKENFDKNFLESDIDNFLTVLISSIVFMRNI